MSSGAVIYVPSFIKIGSSIDKLTAGIHRQTQTHTQIATWSHKHTLFFQNRESRLKKRVGENINKLKYHSSPIIFHYVMDEEFVQSFVCAHAYPRETFRKSWCEKPDFRCMGHITFMFRNYFNLCRIWGFHSGGYEEYHLLEYDAV
jgi:hypothetical protein